MTCSALQPWMLASLLGLTMLSWAGCTFTDGDPWAAAQGDIVVAFDVPDDRIDDAGRLKTADDYLLDLQSLVVEIGPAELIQSGAAADVAFDPANPPDGYSLCHNGHCHAASGELVDYEEIIAGLSGDAGADATRTVVLSPVTGDLSASTLNTNFSDCPDKGCPLPGAPLTGLGIALPSMQMRVGVSDARIGDRQRIDPYELELSLDTQAALLARLSATFEYRSDNALRFDVRVAIPARAMDAIDWAQLEDGASDEELAAAAETLRMAVEEFASITVDLHRTSF